MMAPQKLLAEASGYMPDHTWQVVDAFRAEYKAQWPDYVFVPAVGWNEIVCYLLGKSQLEPELFPLVAVLMAVGSWRPGQDVVRFDPDIFDALAHSEIKGNIPCEILHMLPAWCVYIQTDGWQGLDGFFVYVEADPDTKEEELRFCGVLQDGKPYFYPPLQLGAWDLQTAILKSYESFQPLPEGIDKQKHFEPVQSMLSLTLYLCVNGLSSDKKPTSGISRPAAKKTKNGWRLFPPDKPKVWQVGTEEGEAIRRGITEYRVADDRKLPRPHIRRAHWHTYWTGKGRSISDVKWIRTIAVAMRDGNEKDS